ncbi:Uu.00g088420.m01.CDS01 [Anthostomella pinea]|uniref:Uu.00g088420.m01.CDS01 n=1 Tax=Anthostomella pinea TaxID=933095 RepID=A0AAI8VMF7_9PEZI|nr:Uu.00g088420.m01.CDS01 [Anthostomella pinea]
MAVAASSLILLAVANKVESNEQPQAACHNFGKIMFSVFGGTKLIAICAHSVHRIEPRTAPRASSQGKGVPSSTVGQEPFAYHMLV